MPKINIVVDPEAWESLQGMDEDLDGFMFTTNFNLEQDEGDGARWMRSVNGGSFEDCEVGIPVDELTKMENRDPNPGSSKGKGSSLHGTISSSLLDRIPVEIFDHIIDHIPYSHLPVVALVARSWYASVVHNLYRTVEIDSREEFNSLAMRLRKSPRVQRWATSTEELIIGRPYSKAHSWPTAYLDLIPALRSRMQPILYVVLKQFRHLVSLRLTDAELDSTMSLVRVIRCFHLLESLALARIQIADKEPPAPEPPAQPRAPSCDAIRLKNLTLEFVEEKSLQKIVDMLISSAMCTKLEGLAVALKGVVREALPNFAAPEGDQIKRIIKQSGPALKVFREQTDPAYGLGFPHCSLKSSTDLRYLDLHIYVSLDIDADVPPDADPAILQQLAHTRLGLMIPAQFGLAIKWGMGAHQLCADLMAVRSYRLEHLVVHLNIKLFDLYLKQNVRSCLDMVTSRMQSKPRVHDIMRRRYFDGLRRVDVILDMRHDTLTHALCAKYTPKSVDPVVQELFKPWRERGIVKVSKIFRLNE